MSSRISLRHGAAAIALATVLAFALAACRGTAPRIAATPAAAAVPTLPAAGLPATAAAPARIDVTNAWVRPATAGQAMVPAYLDLRAATAATLVAVESPLADAVEIREPGAGNAGERALTALSLPRDASVRLAPGGNYLALIRVREGFGNGQSVPLWLTFQDDRGVQHIVRVEAQVRGLSLRPNPPG